MAGTAAQSDLHTNAQDITTLAEDFCMLLVSQSFNISFPQLAPWYHHDLCASDMHVSQQLGSVTGSQVGKDWGPWGHLR